MNRYVRNTVVLLTGIVLGTLPPQPAGALNYVSANASGSGCALLGVTTCDLYMFHNLNAWPSCNANGCVVEHYCFMSPESSVPGSATMTCGPNGWQQCVFTSAPGDCYDYNSGTWATWVPMNWCTDFDGRLTVTNTVGTHNIAVRTLRACVSSSGAQYYYV